MYGDETTEDYKSAYISYRVMNGIYLTQGRTPGLQTIITDESAAFHKPADPVSASVPGIDFMNIHCSPKKEPTII
jgi:hypothetical protein